MRIKELLNKNCIKLNLEKTDKLGHIKEMISLLVEDGKISEKNADEICDKVMEREKMGSTGIGDGVAIPHIKTEYVDKIVGAFGISKEGIEFNSLDGKPVYLSFLLLTPEGERNEHLQALAEISAFFKDNQSRNELMEMENEKKAYKYIKKL
ncbi:MAG: PTS sugar transporter subunit IIA [Elusimicrobiota bacterium]